MFLFELVQCCYTVIKYIALAWALAYLLGFVLLLTVKPGFHSFFPSCLTIWSKNIAPLRVSFDLLQAEAILYTRNELIKNWTLFLWCKNFVLIPTKPVIWEFYIIFVPKGYWKYIDENPFDFKKKSRKEIWVISLRFLH